MSYLIFFIFWFLWAYLGEIYLLKVIEVIASLLNLSLFIQWTQKEHNRKKIAFWIWRNLSGGAEPFYRNVTLKKHVAPTPPDAHAWFGLKLRLWIMASSYLVKVGELTYYPTLREKF